jgi:myo-inositol 2-dehydrogenase/D-chiro-inositol 1-dehydrogenase
MHILILGDGAEERAWASWFAASPDHQLEATCPGPLPDDVVDEVRVASDLDEALAVPGIDLAIVGGPAGFRAEALRRAAAEGLAIICLHPPGADSEAYYQVSLSRSETGAVVVPDLPLRLHPGLRKLQAALTSGELGTFRGVRHECECPPSGARPEEQADRDLVRTAFARMVDTERALLGEIEAVTASGDPPGTSPEFELVVQLRAAGGRRAEVRAWAGAAARGQLTVTSSSGSLTLEYDPGFRGPARLIRRIATAGTEEITELEPWDPHAAILQTLVASATDRTRSGELAPSPSLQDGTRAMELTEAVLRSLRRGRTIDLNYDSISEESSFKSIMTSTGCMILLGALLLLPVALAGPPLGFSGTIYLAYLIPPLLVIFVLSQLLRFGIRGEGHPSRNAARTAGSPIGTQPRGGSRSRAEGGGRLGANEVRHHLG